MRNILKTDFFFFCTVLFCTQLSVPSSSSAQCCDTVSELGQRWEAKLQALDDVAGSEVLLYWLGHFRNTFSGVEGIVSSQISSSYVCVNTYQQTFKCFVSWHLPCSCQETNFYSLEAAQTKLAQAELFFLTVGVLSNRFNTEIQLTHLCVASGSDQKTAGVLEII